MAKREPRRAVDLMMDSGVFSAWNRGTQIDLAEYIAYLERNAHLLFSYVNVDVIPGKMGRPRTPAEVEHSAAESYANFQIMKKAGLDPIPVFHQGERHYWLEKYLGDGERYIGLSTAKDIMTQGQVQWLDAIWGNLIDSEGRPKIKTHGFGITKPRLLFAYPWYTVDSTTWSLSPAYGQILVPVYKAGKPDYMSPPIKVVMSGVEHTVASSQKRQYANLGEYSQSCVRRFVEEECGLDVTLVRYGTTLRRKCMLIYFANLAKALYDVRYTGPTHRTFGKDHFNYSSLKTEKAWNLRITHATCLNREWGQLMTQLGARHRLLNYWEMRHESDAILEEYVRTGNEGPEYVKAVPKQKWNSEAYENYRRLFHYRRLKGYEDADPTQDAD